MSACISVVGVVDSLVVRWNLKTAISVSQSQRINEQQNIIAVFFASNWKLTETEKSE